jgi:hypothetical protein
MENKNLFTTKEDILTYLNSQGVAVNHIEDHEKLDNVAAGLERLKTVNFSAGPYVFAKNLFLKNKAGGLYLLTVHNVKFIYLI